MEQELILVFETGDVNELAIVKSLFTGAGIEFMVKGEMLQDLSEE